MLEKSFPWSNTHMSTSDQWQSHAFKNGRAFMNGLTGIKNGFGICQFRAECTGNVNIPRDKNLKDWGRANVGAVPWKLRFCEHISKWGFFPALVGGKLTPDRRPRILDTPCISTANKSTRMWLWIQGYAHTASLWTEWTDTRQGENLFYVLLGVWRCTPVSTGTSLLPVQTCMRIC